jgi:signal transduction histidine kinase
MRLRDLWRITTFRLTVLYGLLFALGTVALLGMIYLQSAVYLTRRLDGILNNEADALVQTRAADLPHRLDDALALAGAETNIFALFASDGSLKAGNLPRIPAALVVGGPAVEVDPTGARPAAARLIARRLPDGDALVVGRDVGQLREMRAILVSALVWSGLAIIAIGVGFGAALSVRPIRRLRLLSATGQEIAAGDLKRRMPVEGRGDELDTFAETVNFMMDEVERLMAEVKGAADTIAHDLRTPLTRARAQLHRLQQAGPAPAEDLGRVIAEIDAVLERFRALMRISELEARERRAGFADVSLAEVAAQVVELYAPLAEHGGVELVLLPGADSQVAADAKLLFEAVSNLVDNAIKFTPAGGRVTVSTGSDPALPQIVVQDDGPGIPTADRAAVLQRFFRAERDRLTPGSGLGLSIVSAIVRLHRFDLVLEDAQPGLRAVIRRHALGNPPEPAG